MDCQLLWKRHAANASRHDGPRSLRHAGTPPLVQAGTASRGTLPVTPRFPYGRPALPLVLSEVPRRGMTIRRLLLHEPSTAREGGLMFAAAAQKGQLIAHRPH